MKAARRSVFREVLVLMTALLATTDAAASGVKAAILDYTNSPATVLNWMNGKFDYKISGNKPNSASMHWFTYVDLYGLGSIAEYLKMKDYALGKNLIYEEILLHAKKNFTSAIGTAWSQMDKFDVFEGAKGVMKYDGSTFTDVTSSAYASSVAFNAPTVYIGYEEPFDQINFVFSTTGQGGIVTPSYWNGTAWVVLPATDGTANLTANGRFAFTPPGGWSPISINGSRQKYFVALALSGYTRTPVSSSIRGDNWLNGAGNACRGWDATATSIINSGPLAYNPAPPATASAKFRYQARISFWSPNHFVANPADFQIVEGVTARSWAKYVAYVVLEKVTASGVSGLMGDDGERNLTADGIPATDTDFVDKTANTWAVESEAKYADMVSYVHQVNPVVEMGINAQARSLTKKGNWNLAEYHSFNWKTNSNRYISIADSTTLMTYDDYLPVNNPNAGVGVLIYQDTQDTFVPTGGGTVTWDRGNRGPLVALSKHLVGMNDFTVFSYYSQGGFIYSNTDEVFLKDGTTIRLSASPVPDLTVVERWATWFPAMGVDFGVPDVAGYNGGVRDFAWKRGVDIGGGLDIWRRDFTNAIVLHRPASYMTTQVQYDTYSNAIPLGATYYPLRADGKTDAGVSSIALRMGEGAILMKTPLNPLPPPPPPLLSPKNLKTIL